MEVYYKMRCMKQLVERTSNLAWFFIYTERIRCFNAKIINTPEGWMWREEPAVAPYSIGRCFHQDRWELRCRKEAETMCTECKLKVCKEHSDGPCYPNSWGKAIIKILKYIS